MTDPLLPPLDQNLLLRAGAGTGKTHALVTLALQLLAGLRRSGATPADQLWLATFTEKAAGELRGRLRERLRGLAQGGGPAAERDLAEAAEQLGRPFPPAERWARLWDEVAACRVTTLHGVGAALLRELPGAGPIGGLETWDEARAREALREAAREVVLAPGAPVGELLLDLPLAGRGDFGQGLLDVLVGLHERMAEDGVSLDDLGAPPPPPPLAGPLAAWRAAFERVARSGGPRVDVAAVRAGLAALPAAADPEAIAARFGDLSRAERAFQKTRGAGEEERREAKAAHEALIAALVEARSSLHWRSLVDLARATRDRYERRKRAEGAVDFADLCRRARDLLRDDPAARRAAKERVGALLLDETQDTNGLQLDLCLLLCERRGREARFAPGERIDLSIDLEPGSLCAVGDRKQSIYDFRGADVAVFERLSERIRATGGREIALRRSRRSRPELVRLSNGLFRRVLAGGERDFEVRFGDEDALEPERPEAGEPLALLLELPEGLPEPREAEARALARFVGGLLREPPASVREALPQGLRPGHVALLFRRLSNADVFREAFAGLGLPTAVGGGSGFYEAQEIRDASALLSACADGEDGLATLTLLRSPWAGLLDQSVARLSFARGERRGLSLRELLAKPPPALAEGEAGRLARLLEALRPWQEAGEALGPARLLGLALSRLPYAASLEDPQAVANLAKLRGVLAAFEAQGLGLAAAADRLARLCRGEGEERREPPAASADDGALEAVRLLSIHEAKGLEFPVVVVPECGATGFPDRSAAIYVRGAGLGVKARGPGGSWGKALAHEAARELGEARERAQALRLLYVAATRARELLVFSGELPRNHAKGSWRELLDAEEGLARLDGGAILAAPEPLPFAPAAVEPGLAEAALAATSPRPPRLERLRVAATAAADLVLCPRRYQLRQLWRLPEREIGAEPTVELPRDDDPRARGSRAHELLEIVDLGLAAREPARAVAEAAERLGAPASEDREVTGEVETLLASPFGRRLCALPPERILRERPFVLRVGPLVVRGSIDLCCVLDEGLLVVDYKRGPPRETAGYRAQVELYALAASRLIAGGLSIEGALWFLGEAERGPRRFAVTPGRLVALESELRAAAAAALSQSPGFSPWTGLDPAGCRAIGCDYLGRCHPAAAAAARGAA